MYLDNCKRELLNYGVEAEIISVNKNGIPHEGLRLGGMEAGIHPIIYPKVGDSLEDVVNQAKIALEHIPDEVNWRVLSDWDYVKEHLYLSVQKHSTDQVFKRDCLNLELIMRVSLDFSGSSASTKVGSSLAKMLGVSEQELWDTAMKNCSKAYEVRAMSDILGIPTDADSSLYVVTTQDAKDGASALAFPHVFRDFCEEHSEQSVYILPSSTEEVLIVPGSSTLSDPQDLAYMVRDINGSIVDPTIQLPAVAYQYRLDTDRIEIVAEA